jgi:hypothetical protein
MIFMAPVAMLAGNDGKFKITVDTTKAGSATDTFILPLESGTTYSFTVEWGDGTSDVITAWNQADLTHVYGSTGVKQISISGSCPRVYFNNGGDKLKITSVDQWGDVGYSADQSNAFDRCNNLASIAEDWDALDAVITDGTNMFRSGSLTALPAGMNLPLLTSGYIMFFANSLTALPAGMALPSMTNGYYMFGSNSLTSLPAGMNLPLLTNGSFMFASNTLSTASYSALLIAMEAVNSNSSVAFHGGSSLYTAAGETARSALIADHTWTFTDGGLEP